MLSMLACRLRLLVLFPRGAIYHQSDHQKLQCSLVNCLRWSAVKIVKRISYKYYNQIWVRLGLQDVSSFEHFHLGHFLTRTAMLFLKQLVLRNDDSKEITLLSLQNNSDLNIFKDFLKAQCQTLDIFIKMLNAKKNIMTL